ncbi:MAG: hypothetical protein HY000_39790, partial [Planctomycetes bacterium]|nr:hypothetical protein [Planctomycetota bacterium]
MSNSNTATYSYRLRIQRDSDGVWFPTGQVSDAYLQEARDQALFESQRRGITGPDPNESVVTEEPLFAPDMDGQISGLTVRVSHCTAQLTTQFTLELFSPASQVEAARLVKAGQLQQEATFRYRVFAQRVENLIGGDRAPGGVVATVRRKPLPLVDGRLSDWLDRARPAGPMYDTDYPVLITEQALELSREYSR